MTMTKRTRHVPVIPGEPHTLESLSDLLNDLRCRACTSPYAIAKASGLNVGVGAVTRLFRGYQGAGDSQRDKVCDPDQAGRVRLDTFLKIVHAMGYDVEIVKREE